MIQKRDGHIFSGMQKDMIVSKQKPEFLWDALNIRLTARDGDTFLSITNEKGTDPSEFYYDGQLIQDFQFTGYYIGHCILGKYLIVFTLDESGNSPVSRIYKLEKTGNNKFELYGERGIICSGPFRFSKDHPIEAIGIYENLDVQKVYWVDGYNPVRFINIADPKYSGNASVSTDREDYFDFVKSLKLEEEVTITKTFGEGSFPAGVLQYHITYYNKYGQESRIAYSSELVYSAFFDRGGAPDDTIANSFRVYIENVDKNFDFLRLYCTIRTSKEAQVTARIVKDFDLRTLGNSTSVTIIDNGLIGESFDPAALLYLGGEELVAGTITSKDNTLFLGDIHLPEATLEAQGTVQATIDPDYRIIENGADSTYSANVLNSYSAGYKGGEYYRLGIQLQDTKGKWSAPIYLGDYKQTNYPAIEEFQQSQHYDLKIPVFSGTKFAFTNVDLSKYKKIRGVVSLPPAYGRKIIAQGFLCPTVYSTKEHIVQSSWFLRPGTDEESNYTTVSGNGNIGSPSNIPVEEDYVYGFNRSRNNLNVNEGAFVQYVHGMPLFDFTLGDRGSEIQGASAISGDTSNDTPLDYRVSQKIVTFHSPDLEFDTDINNFDWNEGFNLQLIGRAVTEEAFGDIYIQTSSPTISSRGSGFEHHSTFTQSEKRLVSGLFYSDYLVNYDDDKYQYAEDEYNPMLFMVFPWQKSGSLNNDTSRPSDGGARSSVLKRKIISNISYMHSDYFSSQNVVEIGNVKCALFNSDQVSLLKLGSTSYYGNVDTALIPKLDTNRVYRGGETQVSNPYLVNVSSDKIFSNGKSTDLFPRNNKADWSDNFLWHFTEWYISPSGDETNGSAFYDDGSRASSDFGTSELRYTKEPIRMKYKSTPHVVIDLGKENGKDNLLMGGTGDTRINDNLYNFKINEGKGLIVAELTRNTGTYEAEYGGVGFMDPKDSVWIPASKPVNIPNNPSTVELTWEWGDTWYQRYDCLKTYAFTNEDENSIVEIGSVICETKVNLGGRYDRNKGQESNLYVSPVNFNLINPVYSQLNNFFTYRILDKDYYKLNDYSNSIVWSKEKLPASDIDTWTSISAANMLNMEGKCGKVNSLQTINDSLYCFQETGISQILFNSRVQIPVSDGVPIEISNGNKVDGYRYVSDSTGITNKYALCRSKGGIYFIDSVSRDLYNIEARGFTNISAAHGFSYWFDSHPELNIPWSPSNYTSKLFYDKANQDLYIVTANTCLVFSEILGQFTSFMSYEGIPELFNIDADFFAYNFVRESPTEGTLSGMFKGPHCNMFGYNKPFYITFVSNNDGALDKIFSNVELRTDFYEKESPSVEASLSQKAFDYIRVWNEYQDSGDVDLTYRNIKPSNIKKKFRIWRIDVPRDSTHINDRIRNPWCYIKLGARAANAARDRKMILHDLSVQYFV